MSRVYALPVVVTDGERGGQGRGFWSEVAGEVDAIVEGGHSFLNHIRQSEGAGRPAGVIVDGDDRLISTVVTVLRRQFGRYVDIPIECVESGMFSTISRSVGGDDARQVRDRIVDGNDWLDRPRQRVSLLRISSSAEPAPLWGCTFGAGAWFKVAEIVQRGGGRVGEGLRSAARSALDAFSGDEAAKWRVDGVRVAIDRSSWGETIGHLMASSLSTTWLGLSAGSQGQPGWVADSKVGSLPGKIARSRMPGFGGHSKPFERIHVNWSSGFVVDGRLIDAGVPHAVEVAPAEGIQVVQ